VGLTRADQSAPGAASRTAAARSVAAGSTLVCPSCGVSGVVCTPPVPGSEAPACHGPVQAGRPVRCHEVRPSSAGDRMIAGRLYVDVVSSFTFWCTRGGPGQVRIGGRRLSPLDPAATSRPRMSP
jgi:hypothetical protein